MTICGSPDTDRLNKKESDKRAARDAESAARAAQLEEVDRKVREARDEERRRRGMKGAAKSAARTLSDVASDFYRREGVRAHVLALRRAKGEITSVEIKCPECGHCWWVDLETCADDKTCPSCGHTWTPQLSDFTGKGR